MMRGVAPLVRKELLVLVRDWHALLLLFVMPAFFIVIMSVALRDRFAADGGAPLTYYLLNQDTHDISDSLAASIRTSQNIRALFGSTDESTLRDVVSHDGAHFLVVIPKGFGDGMMSTAPATVAIYSAPGVDPVSQRLFESVVRQAVARVYLARSLTAMGLVMTMTGRGGAAATTPGRVNLDVVNALVSTQSLYRGDSRGAQPTAVQQNVPGWLVFAMFFVALPLATTWVDERRQGTLGRLRSLGVAPSALLIGKLLPYHVINWVQCAVMLFVGLYVVPLAGGDALSMGHSAGGMIVMVLAISFAAVSYSLLLANVVSTTAQATILTGVCNLLLAVAGGVMVPRFIMPDALQKASLFSPMAWGLEGFLDIFLRDGTAATVLPWALGLAGFGVAALVVAGVLLGRDVRSFRIR